MFCKYQLIVLFNFLWNYQRLTILAKNVFTVIKFYIKETAELVTFTDEIFSGKVHVLCNVGSEHAVKYY